MPDPGPLPPRTPQQKMEDIFRRLDFLRGNTSDVSPDNTRKQNSRIVARKNQERFQNRRTKEREKELPNIPKGIINNKTLSITFNFPDTLVHTPLEDFSCYLQPNLEEDFSRCLQPSPHFLEPAEPRETSFLFSDGNQPESLSPLRKKLRNIAPLPSKSTTLQDQPRK